MRNLFRRQQVTIVEPVADPELDRVDRIIQKIPRLKADTFSEPEEAERELEFLKLVLLRE